MMPTMRELSKYPGNNICSDCESREPDWCSINLGIFICIKCAGVHRSLGVDYSKVRSIDLDTNCWDAEQIQFMASVGNIRANAMYEFNCPIWYMRPRDTENGIIRENWIRAKYVRKQFIQKRLIDSATKSSLSSSSSSSSTSSFLSISSSSPSSSFSSPSSGDDISVLLSSNPSLHVMPEPILEGYLLKENSKHVWQRRYFMLQGRYLYYYKQAGDSYKKGHFDLPSMIVHVAEYTDKYKYSWEMKYKLANTAPSTPSFSSSSSSPLASPPSRSPISSPSSPLFSSSPSSSSFKTYPLAAEKEEDMLRWIHAIRRASSYYQRYSEADMGDRRKARTIEKPTLGSLLSLPPLKAGYLTKQGGNWPSWHKRFCILTHDTLYYFKKTPPVGDDRSEGGIALEGCEIDGEKGTEKNKKKPHSFAIAGGDRTYYLACTSEADLKEWMEAIQRVIQKTMKMQIVDFSEGAWRAGEKDSSNMNRVGGGPS